MTAYLTGIIKVTEPEGYEQYRLNAPATVHQYGGRYLTKPGTTTVISGDLDVERFVILEFPDMAALMAWWDSPEYTPLRELRERSSVSTILFTQGAD